MTEPTKTISVRLPLNLVEQIQVIAKTAGQTQSDWVRDDLAQAVHALTSTGKRIASQPCKPDDEHSLLEAIESRIRKSEHRVMTEIAALKAAILQVAKAQHEDLCLMAQVGQSVEESMKEGLQAACIDVLGAIEDLKQVHESHKDTLLKAIYRPRRRNH
jgi:hypothetical protein